MSEDRDLHDVVGFWSEIKLEIIQKYLPAYTTIVSHQRTQFRTVYVDAFAGSGTHISKETHEFIKGSPALALETQPAFDEYHLIDLDQRKVASLERLAAQRADVTIYRGDCNELLLKSIFPRCKYEDFARAVCLLDPYGLQLDWKVIEAAGKLGSMEIFLNFPVMDINRNAIARDPEKDRPSQAELTRFWGDESWREAAYDRNPGLFGDDLFTKSSNDAFAKAFQRRLKEVAGFGFVPDPIPMRNSQHAIVYYLFFASPNATGGKIVKEIMDRYRKKGFR